MNPLYHGPPSTVRPQSSVSQRSTVNSSINGHYAPSNPYHHPPNVVHSEAAVYNHGYPHPFYDQPHYPEQPHYLGNYNQSYASAAPYGYDQNYQAEQYPASYGTNYYEHNPHYPHYPPPKRQRTDVNPAYNQAQYPPVSQFRALDQSSGHPFAAIPRPPPSDGLPVPIPGVPIPAQTPHAHPGMPYPHNGHYPPPVYNQQYPTHGYPAFHAAAQPTLPHVPQGYQQGTNRGSRYQHGPSTRTWHAPKPAANSTAGSQTGAPAATPAATAAPTAQAANSTIRPPAPLAPSVPSLPSVLSVAPSPRAPHVSDAPTAPVPPGHQEHAITSVQAVAATPEKMSVEEYIKLIKQYEHYEYHDPNAERLPGDDRGTPEPYYHQYDPEQSEVEIDVEDNLCRAKEIVWKPAHRIQQALLSDHWSIVERSTFAAPTLDDKTSTNDNDNLRSISRHADLQELLGRMLSASEMPDWLAMKSDPVFVDIAMDGALISLDEVISRRARKARSVHEMEDVDEDDAEEGEIRRSVGKGGWHLGARLEPSHSHISQISPLARVKQSDEKEDEFHAPTSSKPAALLENVVVKLEDAFDNDAMSVDRGDHEITSNKADDGLMSNAEDFVSEMYSPPPPQLSSPQTRGLRSSMPLLEEESRVADIEITIEEPTEIEPPKEEVMTTIEQDHVPQLKANVVSADLKHLGAVSSTMTHQLPAKPVTYVRDERQEERLARLGVSGAPKPVFMTPGPVRRSRSNSPEKLSFTGNQHRMGLPRTHAPPPPPPPTVPSPRVGLEVVDEYDVWGTNGGTGSPRSITSGHTIAGSDFHDDPLLDLEARNDAILHKEDANSGNATSLPLAKASTRKRGRADSLEREDRIVRQHDDTTPRFRARQPKVDPAYSRRW